MTTFAGGRLELRRGDCLEIMDRIEENSVDAVCTDPPYHLLSTVKRFGKTGSAPAQFGSDGAFARASKGFMGKEWDGGDIAFCPETWAKVLRVLKPGGHLVAFSAPKCQHRMVCAIEDAGFEIRDGLMWLFGCGFPKSLDVSKAIDKAAGAERTKVGRAPGPETSGTMAGSSDTRPWIVASREAGFHEVNSDEPVTADAMKWAGWGSALKPAYEPILLGSKPVTMEQHFAIVIEEIDAILFEVAKWSNANANDAGKHFFDIQAKCSAEANSVLANAKIRSLESIGICEICGTVFYIQRARINRFDKDKGSFCSIACSRRMEAQGRNVGKGQTRDWKKWWSIYRPE